MSNLLSTLLGSANALRAFDQALNTVQNNVSNVATPGYARQVPTMVADRFVPEAGFNGGVHAGPVVSRRSQYAEEAVRRQQSSVGFSEQRRSDLERLEPLFAPIANSGLPGAFSKFFQAFSQVAVSPNSATVRQVILDRATDVAHNFQQTAEGIQSSREAADRQLRSTVDSINGLLERIRQFNIGRRQNAEAVTDAGVDANLHQTLEELAELVDFQALETSDRSITILLGGSQPAVSGDHSFPVSARFGESGVQILSRQGEDIGGKLASGRLGALLEERNVTLPSYLSRLNQLATGFADGINQQLAAGLDQAGNPPGAPLFQLDASYPALKLAVNPLEPAGLALASAAAPGGSGNALTIAGMAARDSIDGSTYTEFFGTIGAAVGRDLNQARDARETHMSLLAQAQNIREQTQGVSLDEEAATLLVFQKAYEASSRIIKVVDELTETLLGIMR